MNQLRNNKPYLSHSDLVSYMESLGMDVGDREAAQTVLKEIGYHRLKGYSYPFRRPLLEEEVDAASRKYRADEFLDGTTLIAVERLYSFDEELRTILWAGLTDFEVRLRAAISHVLARRDPSAHVSMQHLDQRVCTAETWRGTKLERWIETCDKAAERASEEDYVVHHKTAYTGPLPVWATLELVSFGQVPFLLDLMKDEDRNAVARAFGVRDGRAFTTWVRALVDVRNRCAHHSRAFNHRYKVRVKVTRSSVPQGQLPDLVGRQASNRIYAHAAVLGHFLRSHVGGSRWPLRFRSVMENVPTDFVGNPVTRVVDPHRDMGFPEGWKDLPLWSVREH